MRLDWHRYAALYCLYFAAIAVLQNWPHPFVIAFTLVAFGSLHELIYDRWPVR